MEESLNSQHFSPVVPISEGKEKITIRLDAQVVDWFRLAVDKAGGGNYQTLINQALCDYIEGKSPKIEDALRRIIREEISAKPKRREPLSA